MQICTVVTTSALRPSNHIRGGKKPLWEERMMFSFFCRKKMELDQGVFQTQKLGNRRTKERWRLCDHFYDNQKDVHPGLHSPFSLCLSEGESDPGEGEKDVGGGSGTLPSLKL